MRLLCLAVDIQHVVPTWTYLTTCAAHPITASSRFPATIPPQVRWHPLPAHIKGVYDHSLVAHNGRLLAFGGHLCADTKGSDPFFYTNRLTALDASEDMARLERHACLSHDEL